MYRGLALALLVALFVQDSPDPARIGDLVRKLGSEDLAEREEATRKLKELGRAPEAELRKAAEGSNPEAAARAKALLGRIALIDSVTPALERAVPGALDRLAGGRDEEWVRVFVEAESLKQPSSRLPLLKRADLEPLAARALKASESPASLCLTFRRRGLRSADAVLIQLLSDPNREVREVAAIALGPVPCADAVKRLRELALAEKVDDARVALEALGAFRVREGLSEIAQRMSDPDGNVRRFAISAMAKIRGREAIPDLVAALKDPFPTARSVAIQALNELYARETGPEIVKLLEDPEPYVREEAFRTMGQLNASSGVATARRMLKKGRQDQRTALGYLRIVAAKEAVADVLPLLEDPDEGTRHWALNFLADNAPKEAREAALKAVKDSSRYVRGAAARVIDRAGVPEDVALLRELLKDGDEHIRAAAAEALGRWKATEAVPDLAGLLKDSSTWDRRSALQTLCRLGAASEVPKIRALLKDAPDLVKWAAVDSLVKLGAVEAKADVEPLLKDPGAQARAAAARALAKWEGRSASPKLVPLLQDPLSYVCMQAMEALARVEAWEAEAEVARLLEDLDPEVRRRAAEWLALAGSTRGIAVFLEDDDAHFTALNAQRSPEAWNRLRTVSTPAKLKGNGLECLRLVAAEAGMKVQPPSELAGPPARWLDGASYEWEPEPGTTAASELLRSGRDAPYGVVIEGDRLRILPRGESAAFWRAWWKETDRPSK